MTSKKESTTFIQLSTALLNSDAYIDLGYSARTMLVEMVHFFNGINNGRIFISKEMLASRGISRNTATKALKELTSHGFIYMTKKGGNLNGGCSLYALTWKPIKSKLQGQNFDNFVPNAYKKWQGIKKNDRSKNGSVKHQNLGLRKSAPILNQFKPHINQAVRLKQMVAMNPNICDL